MKTFFFLPLTASTLSSINNKPLRTEKNNSLSSSAPITNFESALPPSHYSELYRENELRGGHVIMLGADEDSQKAAREALAAWPDSLQVGGGVNASNAARWLSAGASHVIVTSAVFRDGRLDEEALRELVAAVGRERLVLDLSCRLKKKDSSGVSSLPLPLFPPLTTLTSSSPTGGRSSATWRWTRRRSSASRSRAPNS